PPTEPPLPGAEAVRSPERRRSHWGDQSSQTWRPRRPERQWSLRSFSDTSLAEAPLCSGLHEHHATTRARNGDLEEEQAILCIHRMNLEVLDRHPSLTHATSHTQALENTARSGAATDRPGRAMLALRTVRSSKTTETMALHDARGSLAFGCSHDVDQHTRF